MSIRILAPHVAAMIAAGEVVERPSSIVKELLENAIDAGASAITIDVRGSGLNYIKIHDNGCGMSVEDLKVALHRHATSKLCDDDILKVSTLGYRGEALPSIAVVSNISIISRMPSMDCAFVVSSNHGAVSTPRPSAGQFGTIVEVSGLFERHPARQKFQKSTKTETASIREVIASIALSHPAVDFRFTINNIDGRYPKRMNLAERCGDILGTDFSGNSLLVSHSQNEIRVDGLTCLPTADRSDASGIRIAVNGRVVTDRLIRSAVQSAYSSMIGQGRHPQAYISITVPSHAVDINVHPRKSEVRFSDPTEISMAVRTAVECSLDQSGLRSPTSISDLARAFSVENDVEVGDKKRLPLGQYLGQAHGSWLISETADGIVIVDQHAAHERVVLERLKAHVGGESLTSFVYPEPVSLSVSISEAASVDEVSDSLTEVGFSVRVIGEVVILHSVPDILSDVHPVTLISLLTRCAVDGVSSGLLKEAVWEKLATAACRAAIKAGDVLTPERADKLLREIEATPNASYCNHGRPTVAFLKNGDLAKLFARS